MKVIKRCEGTLLLRCSSMAAFDGRHPSSQLRQHPKHEVLILRHCESESPPALESWTRIICPTRVRTLLLLVEASVEKLCRHLCEYSRCMYVAHDVTSVRQRLFDRVACIRSKLESRRSLQQRSIMPLERKKDPGTVDTNARMQP